MDGLTIQTMSSDDVQELVSWAKNEGWNPGVHDARTFYQVDLEGFIAAKVDGRLVGGGAIIRHHDSFGFMGLFLVAPEFRGKGIGRELWFTRRNRLLNRMSPGASIGMDAVDTMQDFYSAGGFRPDYRVSRFQWKSKRTGADRDGSFEMPSNIVNVSAVSKESLGTLDHQCFPGLRNAYLNAWLDQPDIHSLACVSDTGAVRGYGVMRPAHNGWKIGPLFAEEDSVANALLDVFLAHAGEEMVFIDVPQANQRGVQMYLDRGMNSIFECTRMYYGARPAIDLSRIYGVTTLELG